MTLELENVSGLELGFNQVQALRDLLDSVLSLGSHCNGALRVVKVLQEIDVNDISGLCSSLDAYSTQLLDCVESVSVLRSRISNLIDLVRPFLGLRLIASLICRSMHTPWMQKINTQSQKPTREWKFSQERPTPSQRKQQISPRNRQRTTR